MIWKALPQSTVLEKGLKSLVLRQKQTNEHTEIYTPNINEELVHRKMERGLQEIWFFNDYLIYKEEKDTNAPN